MSEALTPFSEWKCGINRKYFCYVVNYVVRKQDVTNQKTAK
jgi:hypothetical protein